MKYWTLGALVLYSCVLASGCGEEGKSSRGFFEGKAQLVDQREVREMPSARDSVSLLSLEVFELEDFFVQGNDLYLPRYKDTDGKVLVVNKETLTPEDVIGRGTGQGPGEVQNSSVHVANGRVIFYAMNQHKIAVYDTSGAWISDVRPTTNLDKVVPLGDRFVIGSDVVVVEEEGRPALFHVVDMDGNVMEQFGPSGSPDLARSDNPLAYIGHIAAGPSGEHLYFGGFSEPLLKKYKIGGEQIFSRKTVDNLPSEVNYLIPQSNESTRMWRFSNHSLFSIETISVFRDYLLVGPINDVEGDTLKYIDVYSAQDGSYMHSYRMPNFVEGLAVDEGGIYTMESIDGKMYLKVYKNMLKGGVR